MERAVLTLQRLESEPWNTRNDEWWREFAMNADRRTANRFAWMLRRKPDDKVTRIDEANWRATLRNLGLGCGAFDQLCHEEEALERERRTEPKAWSGAA